MNLIVRVASSSDCCAILEFLRKHYYPEEPLTQSLKPYLQADEDEEFNMSNVQHGTCIIAYEINNLTNVIDHMSSEDYDKLLGVIIAGPKYTNEAEHLLEDSRTVKSSKWASMLKLLSKLEVDSNVYQRYNVTKAIHAHAIAVDKVSRGKSIGIKMLQVLKNIAKKLDFPLLTLDCTSFYSIRICEKLNMECINEMYFKDYMDEEGNQIFQPPEPHNVIRTFATKL